MALSERDIEKLNMLLDDYPRMDGARLAKKHGIDPTYVTHLVSALRKIGVDLPVKRRGPKSLRAEHARGHVEAA